MASVTVSNPWVWSARNPTSFTIQKPSPSFPASRPGVQVPHSLQCLHTSKGLWVQHFCSQRSNPVNALVLAELLLKCFADSRAHPPLRRASFEGLLSVHIVPNQAFPMLDMSSLSDIFCLYAMTSVKCLWDAMSWMLNWPRVLSSYIQLSCWSCVFGEEIEICLTYHFGSMLIITACAGINSISQYS